MYDSDLLQEINDNVDLLDYVNDSIPMERRGRDWFGHCPLHLDKTPSFSISPSNNTFYCFSCGRHGKFLGYLLQYEGLSFDEAVKKGARLANIDINAMCKSETISYLKKTKALTKKKEVVSHEILDEEILQKYQNGPSKEWIEEGIPKEVQDIFGVRIDTWHNRIVYPVRDIDGHLINVKGRTRYEKYKVMGISKYMNYFKIGTMDYFQGLDITLPYVRECGELIIFESVKSVMKVYAWGYRNAASAEKHTLTDEQIALLVRLRCNIVFAYDSDISYNQDDVRSNINTLKRMTNVFLIEDRDGLLGGKDAKNSPADLTKEIWDELYASKRKIT